MLWSIQDLQNDAWVVACIEGRGSKDNCPANAGPDFDFGASPMLKDLPNGKSVLIAAQKIGMVWLTIRIARAQWCGSHLSRLRRPAPRGK